MKENKIVIENISITDQKSYKRLIKSLSLMSKSVGHTLNIEINHSEFKNLTVNPFARNQIEREFSRFLCENNKD